MKRFRMDEGMAATDRFSGQIQDALNQDVLKRLPRTFLPYINQQLAQWDHLFPNERESVERLLLFVAHMNHEQSAALFRDVIKLEDKMGVHGWQFSTFEQTIENSSQLARSPYFQEWRRAVQAVFDASDRDAAEKKETARRAVHRLVLLEIPKPLPLDAATAWRRWQGIGKVVNLDPGSAENNGSALESLLVGTAVADTHSSDGILQALQSRGTAAPADAWVVDAGRELVDSLAARGNSSALLLSYGRLDAFRENFSHEMNSMRKDLTDADAVFDRLRKVDVSPWCPAEVAAYPAVREFVRSLYLSGNGAVIFGNSFVEWAASEAFRRARPAFLAARFGLRSKPKPFTGVAVFENPDQVNPLPPVDDLDGSAIDARMLALYVWLAACRYDEYQDSTVCACIAETLSQVYVVAPPEFSLPHEAGPVSLGELRTALSQWMVQI